MVLVSYKVSFFVPQLGKIYEGKKETFFLKLN